MDKIPFSSMLSLHSPKIYAIGFFFILAIEIASRIVFYVVMPYIFFLFAIKLGTSYSPKAQ